MSAVARHSGPEAGRCTTRVVPAAERRSLTGTVVSWAPFCLDIQVWDEELAAIQHVLANKRAAGDAAGIAFNAGRLFDLVDRLEWETVAALGQACRTAANRALLLALAAGTWPWLVVALVDRLQHLGVVLGCFGTGVLLVGLAGRRYRSRLRNFTAYFRSRQQNRASRREQYIQQWLASD